MDSVLSSEGFLINSNSLHTDGETVISCCLGKSHKEKCYLSDVLAGGMQAFIRLRYVSLFIAKCFFLL